MPEPNPGEVEKIIERLRKVKALGPGREFKALPSVPERKLLTAGASRGPAGLLTSSLPKAEIKLLPQGSKTLTAIFEDFRAGKIEGDVARRSIFQLAKQGHISKEKAKDYISMIGEQPGKEPINLGPGNKAVPPGEERKLLTAGPSEDERKRKMSDCSKKLQRTARKLVKENPDASYNELLELFEKEDDYRDCVDIHGTTSKDEAKDILRAEKDSFDRKREGKTRRAHTASLFRGGAFMFIFSLILILLIFFILIPRIGFNLGLGIPLFIVYLGIFYLAWWSGAKK